LKKILFILFILFASSVQAATYYVAKAAQGGSDSNTCIQAQTIGTAKLTINAGIACMGSGDTLYIRTGTYTENLYYGTVTFPSGTSWSNAVTISGYSSEIPVLDGYLATNFSNHPPATSYVIFQNMKVNLAGSGGSVGIGGDHIRLQDVEVTGSYRSGIMTGANQTVCPGACNQYLEFIRVSIHDNGEHGIYMQSSNNLVEDCDIYDNGGWSEGWNNFGIQLQNGYTGAQVSNNTIRNNKFHGMGINCGALSNCGSYSAGITAAFPAASTGNLLYNNIFYNNHYGILLKNQNIAAYNNTVYGSTYDGIQIQGTGSHSGMIIRNNISYGNGGDQIEYNGSDYTQSNNLTTDPHFLNAATYDFHLTAASTGAIDQGYDLSGTLTTDFEGNLRTVPYDIGAYLYGAAGNEAPTITLTSHTNGSTSYQSGATVNATGTSSTDTTSITCSSTGGACSTEDTQPSWAVNNIPLTANTLNTITITASDGSLTDAKTFYVYRDNANPTVTITSPTSAATYSTAVSAVSLGGTASDAGLLSNVTWACATSVPSAGSASGLSPWSITPLALTPGDNTIVFTATDAAGNTGTDQIVITYTPLGPGGTGTISRARMR
jgi:parallel beta-helix repeat protein